MRYLVAILCTFLLTDAISAVAGPSRVRRNLYQFSRMITCATDRSAFDFNGYGCWCGYGGSGTPVDAIDRCCKTHDECYESAIDSGCNPYFVNYSWQCTYPGNIVCGSGSTCATKACQCDRDAARCFKTNLQNYNSAYKNYNNC